LTPPARVHHIDRLAVTGQHTDCYFQHASYDASDVPVTTVSDATAVYEPFTVGRYQQAQHDALCYLRTDYGAEVTTSEELA